MTRRRWAPWALGFGVAATGASVAAADENLEPPVLVMYEKVGMSGREISYKSPVADIDVRYPFHSASVKSGRWELCTRNDFKGACLDLGPGDEIESLKKEFGFFARVRSLRPLVAAPQAAEAPSPKHEIISSPRVAAEPAPAPDAAAAAAAIPAAPVASAEAVLRGHNAHFFKTPMFDGAAIEAGDAKAFCREAGFGKVEFSASVLRDGRPVIGDLLCGEPLQRNAD
jgi:hypothetical protein